MIKKWINNNYFVLVTLVSTLTVPIVSCSTEPFIESDKNSDTYSSVKNVSKPKKTRYVPAIDFAGVDTALKVQPKQVLVLGTVHLSHFKDTVKPSDLNELLDRLARFGPDIITIESMPGELCRMMKLNPKEYPNVPDQYCSNVDEQKSESGFTAQAAATEIRDFLSDVPLSPTPQQRRRLAAAFLTTEDVYSALVQWLRLTESERKIGNGIGEQSLEYLTKLSESSNEISQIAARLAARLGHERVYPAEDHTTDIIFAHDGEVFWDRLGEIWSSGGEEGAEYRNTIGNLFQEKRIIEAYRELNSIKAQKMVIKTDFQRAMNDEQGVKFGQKYVAWWQARNLKMVSMIVATSAEKPGAKILSIVGASHKPYFESYLDVMHDVELVDALEILK